MPSIYNYRLFVILPNADMAAVNSAISAPTGIDPDAPDYFSPRMSIVAEGELLYGLCCTQLKLSELIWFVDLLRSTAGVSPISPISSTDDRTIQRAWFATNKADLFSEDIYTRVGFIDEEENVCDVDPEDGSMTLVGGGNYILDLFGEE